MIDNRSTGDFHLTKEQMLERIKEMNDKVKKTGKLRNRRLSGTNLQKILNSQENFELIKENLNEK